MTSAVRFAVYRFFDAAGALLYVGMTKNPANRRSDHRRSKPWFGDIAATRTEWFDTPADAARAEQAAIATESPRHNVMAIGEEAAVRDAESRYAPPKASGPSAELLDGTDRYHRAEAAVESARIELTEAICEEARAGTKQRELVKATGLTREHIRRICRAGGIGPE